MKKYLYAFVYGFLFPLFLYYNINAQNNLPHRIGQDGYACGTLFLDKSNELGTPDNLLGSGSSCGLLSECWGFGHNSCADNSPTDCLYRVPIIYHIVRETDGGGGIASATIDADFAALNVIFSDMNIEFFECCPRDFIDDSDLYDFESYNGDLQSLIDVSYKVNTINIYIVDNGAELGTAANPFTICGAAPFPGGQDFIIMNEACMGIAETMGHEMGHYFGLRHPHTDPFGQIPTTTQENPTNDNSNTDYCICYGNGFGDGIGDTPPDPIMSENCAGGAATCIVDNTCTIQHTPGNGPALTANDCSSGGGTLINVNVGDYNPNVDNIMNFASYGSCNANKFTACQRAKIIEVLLDCRGYLCCSDPSANIAANSSDYFEICPGDPLPSFEATSSCYDWFDSETGGNLLQSGSSGGSSVFNIPTMGIGAVDNNVSGLYEFWLTPTNAISPNCRLKMTLNILPLDASFDCPPGNELPQCEGLFELNPLTTGGTWSGNAAPFVSNNQIDLVNMVLGIDYTLVYTTTDANGCEDEIECAFQVVNNCAAEGGKF